MGNRIVLDLDKTVSRLAGYPLGKSIYEKQVKQDIDLSQHFVLVFPDNITKLASSFVQGFFGEIVEKIGISGVEHLLDVESVNSNMKKEILENLL